MDSSPISLTKLASSLVIKAIILVLTGMAGWVISLFLNLDEHSKNIAVGVFIFAAAVILFLWHEVSRMIDDFRKRRLENKISLVRIYPELASCKSDMQLDFSKANDIRLLLQIGRKEIGGGITSFFYSLATQKNTECKIRILRASPDSPFLSEERAKFREEKYGSSTKRKDWVTGIMHVTDQIKLLRDRNVRIEDRLHKEPFIWRIFLFDDIAYLSVYSYVMSNDTEAPVYKFVKNENSFYFTLDKYFEYLWKKYEVVESLNVNDHWKDWECDNV